jgi:F-type H+-transporting ATPase subunit a
MEKVGNAFAGILELVSEFIKILSFSFRLFGNIFAGEVLLIVVAYLAAFLISLPFMGLELFVGLVQALIFSMLSLVFFMIATAHHD